MVPPLQSEMSGPKDDYVEILINTKILILACTTGITKKQGDRELLRYVAFRS